MLHDVIARALFSIFNHACVSTDVIPRMFRQPMNKIDEVVDNDTPFHKDFANEHELSAVCEWDLMLLAAFIAGEDVDLHANLRRDIAVLTPAKDGSTGEVMIDMFQAVPLMEVLHPIKFDMFVAEKYLMEFNVSGTFSF